MGRSAVMPAVSMEPIRADCDAVMEEIETAHHEAGHAVMGCAVGRLPLSTTILRVGPAAGRTDFERSPKWRYLDESPPKRAYTEQRVLTELAGSVAHDIFQPGRPQDIGDETDLRITRELISELVSWQESREDYLVEARAKAVRLLQAHWAWVEAVARALLERKTLLRDEILSCARKGGSKSMSLRMIRDVLKPRDVATHCPLCGRALARFPSNEEHIFPKWLQHHHNLWNRRLTIPNFLGKNYKTVKITICERCNGTTFGKLETRIAPLFTSADPFAAATTLDDAELAVWLGKIFWLLARKSHSAVDYRTRDFAQPERILPDDLLPGTLFLGMLERTYAMRKGMACCHDGDLAIPELF